MAHEIYINLKYVYKSKTTEVNCLGVKRDLLKVLLHSRVKIKIRRSEKKYKELKRIQNYTIVY